MYVEYGKELTIEDMEAIYQLSLQYNLIYNLIYKKDKIIIIKEEK